MKYPEFTNPTCASIGTEAYYVETKALDDLNIQAKALCKQCPDFDVCLDWALAHEEQGIWAGTTNAERNRMRKQLGITFIPITTLEFVRGDYKDVYATEA